MPKCLRGSIFPTRIFNQFRDPTKPIALAITGGFVFASRAQHPNMLPSCSLARSHRNVPELGFQGNGGAILHARELFRCYTVIDSAVAPPFSGLLRSA
jgi:hypothetical protein